MYLFNIFVLYLVNEISPVIIHLDVKQYHIPKAGFQFLYSPHADQ